MNDKIFKWGKAFVFCPVLLTLLMISNNAFSIVSILKATGGAISADKAENASSPSYTTIGNIRITEGGITNFSLGTNVTFTINAPAGWKFNTAAAVTVTHVNGRDISTSSVLSKTTTDITIQLTVGGLTKLDILTVAAIHAAYFLRFFIQLCEVIVVVRFIILCVFIHPLFTGII